jgi:hypothetical protein
MMATAVAAAATVTADVTAVGALMMVAAVDLTVAERIEKAPLAVLLLPLQQRSYCIYCDYGYHY